ncbi:branched-chain amino acid transport system ATP-binding protein [Amycolatopsis bartoniae]|uniref:ABC transporter domain-containing protein n=1 Tax=Amycolatopsis bartoniae TaxID=941986 RepID=A0A8H9M8I2_9PSEU|nr:ABC transporter ATP-binding protein [Amycolatopsis bartoniae]MBB2938387.1 branched-chain amino acid transport system ATP-binding protein [Amycolatopsis bartoniae]TVT10210.1 ABC transporter ATP-binding protein [Amycolatopsis bartoniae]GHF34829.1 hypothetical protein GCM10017566_04420 [Amycolatopsis bartoniae]
MTAALETVRLGVTYGGNKALDDVSLSISEGELVGLIGPNGAGKTTFIDAITGFTRCSGNVMLEGTDISGDKPHVRARKGLNRTWQGAELYDELTVRENLEVGAANSQAGGGLRKLLTGRGPAPEAVDRALDLLKLRHLADDLPEALPQGRRKMVDVARAFAAGGRVLCLDEPAAGLDSDESLELGRRLRSLVDAGTSLLLVDHDMGLVLSVCDRIYVLDLGRVIAVGTPEEIRSSDAVVKAYLGEEGTAA